MSVKGSFAKFEFPVISISNQNKRKIQHTSLMEMSRNNSTEKLEELSSNTRNNTFQLSSIIYNCENAKSVTRKINQKLRLQKKKIKKTQYKMKHIIRISQQKHLEELKLPLF